MPGISNAFKFRAADRTVLETSLFLNLYSPALLDQLSRDDFYVPKLLVLRGSPGSGKSSLLRLFETETLLALQARKSHQSYQALVTRLGELGIMGSDGLATMGIYLHCDSSLRDIANVDVDGANSRLLNTILDVRIMSGFLHALPLLYESKQLNGELDNLEFVPLPSTVNPPLLFSKKQTVSSLLLECQRIEADFATLLNSFPGDPIPDSIQPHSRMFSIPYLGHQKESLPGFGQLIPIVMVDDVHELYETQRNQLRQEFIQRSSIPRLIAIRKHVYELEDLISLEGAIEDRDFRELDLDSTSTAVFRKFVTNVANRRMQQSSALQEYNVTDFRAQLRDREPTVTKPRIQKSLDDLSARLTELSTSLGLTTIKIPEETDVPVDALVSLEAQLIMAERHSNRRQPVLFPEFEELDPPNAKTQDAARLFAARRFDLPYYFSFETLSDAANSNVEQFLSIASGFADKMIFRAELGRELSLSAQEQDDLMRRNAVAYYNDIEQRFDRGYAIRQLIDNLAEFFSAVTNRPTAPIAPGVNGFGLPQQQLRRILTSRGNEPGIAELKRVLISAVAGNVVFVQLTKQGQAGATKIVFYINRLLCVKYGLPLNTGGWQTLRIDTLIKMMTGPVPAKEWGKRWLSQSDELGGLGE